MLTYLNRKINISTNINKKVLGTFPKAFSRGRLPKWQICNFLNGKFPNVHFPKKQFPK